MREGVWVSVVLRQEETSNCGFQKEVRVCLGAPEDDDSDDRAGHEEQVEAEEQCVHQVAELYPQLHQLLLLWGFMLLPAPGLLGTAVHLWHHETWPLCHQLYWLLQACAGDRDSALDHEGPWGQRRTGKGTGVMRAELASLTWQVGVAVTQALTVVLGCSGGAGFPVVAQHQGVEPPGHWWGLGGG